MNNLDLTLINTTERSDEIIAADAERLSWRVGGEEPTERALQRDVELARGSARMLLERRLGGVAVEHDSEAPDEVEEIG